MGGQFRYLICAECGSLFIEDEKLDVSPYYPSDYYSFANDRPGLLGTLDRAVFRNLAKTHVSDLVKAGVPISPKSKILDIGSGSGMLLRAFQHLGFSDVAGVDPYLDKSVNTGSVKILRTTLDALSNDAFYAGSVDVIMFHHSLEHVPEPVETLMTAAKLLSAKGAILVRLPLISFAWEKYRENWFGLETPRHLAIPTENGMLRAADRSGFRVSRIRYDSSPRGFVASEAYKKGKSFVEAFPASPPRTIFRMLTSVGYALKARRLNSARKGDQAAFVLNRKS